MICHFEADSKREMKMIANTILHSFD